MKIITIPNDATPRPATPANADGVLSALRRAASQTGADFGYLLRTAMRESSLNPAAQAATSSAAGLFQFIEQTWLGTLQRHGAAHGMKDYAEAIQVGSNGRFQVTDKALHQEILALRKDPAAAALMAGEMTNDMRGGMEAALGRGVSAGELYAAHFLGPKAATKLIKAAEATPSVSAAEIFPQAAAANTSIFYNKGGEARSVASVLDALRAKHEGLPQQESVAPVETAEATAGETWRGSVAEAGAMSRPARPTGFVSQVTVIAPVMAQLLASLDPLPHLAAVLADREPELRPSEPDAL